MLSWLQRRWPKRRGSLAGERLSLRLDNGRELWVTRFDAQHAATVASWLRAPRDSFWAAPRSSYPVQPDDVQEWADHADLAFHAWTPNADAPCAYGEVNNFRMAVEESWIGHIIVDPVVRGQAVGRAFVHALVYYAITVLKRQAVSLVVFPDNVHAIRCYHRAGFRDAGMELKRFPPDTTEHRLLRMVWTPLNAALPPVQYSPG